MISDSNSWLEPFKVRSYELSPNRELSITSLCDYLQEAAGRHARHLGASIDHLAENDLTWVLARLDLAFEGLPRWRDDVVVETWPSRMRGFVARREFLVRQGDRIAARATSAWLVIDLHRRRPARLTSELLGMEVPDRPPALSGAVDSLPKLETEAESLPTERKLEVGYGDLDINRHVNHVKYVDWALESLPADFHENHRPAGLEADFRSEVHYPAEVVARARVIRSTEGATVLHQLVSGGKAAARLRTRWLTSPTKPEVDA